MSVLRLIVCLCALVVTTGSTSAAESTAIPALPAWPDQAPSVYTQPESPPAQSAVPSAPPIQPVTPAKFEAPAPLPQAAASPAASEPRRVTPRNRHLPRPTKLNPASAATDVLPSFGVPFESLYSTGAALAVVLGLFLLFATLVRRGAKKSNGLLPEEVVSVLGRVPLAARQFAELVRVGNKLVLVSVTPAGAEPLTEITDPAEIDRLVGLCRSGKKGSSTDEFDQIFRQLADETAPSGFLGQEAPRVDARLAAPADVYSAYRGGSQRG